MKTCSECGQVLPLDGARVWIEEVERVVVVDGERIQLTKYETRLVDTLLERMSKPCSINFLMERIYPLEQDEPSNKIISVFIWKIRGKLFSTALRIKVKWGVGYYAELDEL